MIRASRALAERRFAGKPTFRFRWQPAPMSRRSGILAACRLCCRLFGAGEESMKFITISAMALLVVAVFAVAAGAQAAQNNQPPQAEQNMSSQAPANEANETLSPE